MERFQYHPSEPEFQNYFINRIRNEEFKFVKSIPTSTGKTKLREAFESFASHMDVQRLITEIQMFSGLKEWQARRIALTEYSKLRTLSYIDMLNDQGEYLCYVPKGGDQNDECMFLIDGRIFRTETLLNNVYRNYGISPPRFPAVPLHPNCKHYVTRLTLEQKKKYPDWKQVPDKGIRD